MSADASTYAVLGLAPDADWPSVERAYRNLIKRYHPDREGGDGRRAAEIIHAYRDIRRAHLSRGELVLYDESADAPAISAVNRRVRVALLVIAALIFFLIASGPGKELIARLSSTAVPQRGHAARPAVNRADPMDSPLSSAAIDGAIREASHIFRTKNEDALVTRSRDCQRELRSQPSLERLDGCAAFDDAVIVLQDRDPLRDQGPFGELSVTGRQMSAGTTLSNDYVAIDGRLDRIRLQVELALARPPDPAPEIVENVD